MPDFKADISRRLADSRLSPAREAEILEEVNAHLEDRYRELQASGLGAEEARRGALEELQDEEGLAERLRAIERPARVEPSPPGAPGIGKRTLTRLIDETAADLQYGVRQLRATPAFTAVAVLTLAIGIGANTAIFTQANAVFLKTLPVGNPEELRRLEWTSPTRTFATPARSDLFRTGARDIFEYFSYPAYQFLREHTSGFSDLACFAGATINLSIGGSAESVRAELISGNYLRTLGVAAFAGRTITPDDDRPGSVASVAMLGHGFWLRAFGGDTSAIGQTVAVNGEAFTVVGVAPKGFFGADPRCSPDLLVPMAKHEVVTATPKGLANARNWATVQVIGRLRPGVSDEQARLDTEALLGQAIRADPPPREYVSPRVLLFGIEHGIDVLRRQTSLSLYVLMSVVGVVLLLACTNIASLLLARADARGREMATRLALGARRGRLVRQLLTESLLLSGLGGSLGVLLAYTLGGLLPTPLTSPMSAARPAPTGLDLAPDLRVLAFAVGVAVATGLVFGIAPALRATRVDVLSMMKQAPTSSGRGRRRKVGVLVTVQIALSLLLLIGTTLFIRTLANLRSEPLGFDPDGVLVFQVNPSLNGYRDERLSNFFEEALTRFEQLPGVVSASLSGPGLVSGAFSGSWVCVPDRQPDRDRDTAWLHRVAPRLFETMRIPLLLGRDIDWRDRERGQKVVIVNQAFVNKYYPGVNAVGKTIGLGQAKCDAHEMTIVAVAADTKYWTVRNPISPTMYLPYRQLDINGRAMTVALRAKGDPTALAPAARQAMRDLDPNVPIFQVSTQVSQIDRGLQQERMLTSLLVLFGLVALLLAAIGIYGTLSYSVARRTPEIGLRMAIGAQRVDVVRLVVGESLAPVTFGMLVGLGGAFGLTRLVQGLLFGVAANDPLTMAGAAFVLLAVAAVAASLPARRASRIDPMTALRSE